MKSLVAETILAGLLAVAGCSTTPQQSDSPGPNGGDMVPIKDGTAYAEVLANPDTGEVMVQTYDTDFKTRRPIENAPITVGSADNSVELSPRPTDSDPAGTCSRFYGQAEWVRGGGARRGWVQARGMRNRQEFEWRRGWEAGRANGRMWEDLGERRRMGPMHGPGGPGEH